MDSESNLFVVPDDRKQHHRRNFGRIGKEKKWICVVFINSFLPKLLTDDNFQQAIALWFRVRSNVNQGTAT
jgi:hypothetical protein